MCYAYVYYKYIYDFIYLLCVYFFLAKKHRYLAFMYNNNNFIFVSYVCFVKYSVYTRRYIKLDTNSHLNNYDNIIRIING